MEKKKFVVPHVYILLLALILVFSLLSYVIPSNVYDYHDVVVNPETGQTRSVVDPETPEPKQKWNPGNIRRNGWTR